MSANMTDVQIPAEPAPRPVPVLASPARMARVKKELTMLAVLIGLALTRVRLPASGDAR